MTTNIADEQQRALTAFLVGYKKIALKVQQEMCNLLSYTDVPTSYLDSALKAYLDFRDQSKNLEGSANVTELYTFALHWGFLGRHAMEVLESAWIAHYARDHEGTVPNEWISYYRMAAIALVSALSPTLHDIHDTPVPVSFHEEQTALRFAS